MGTHVDWGEHNEWMGVLMPNGRVRSICARTTKRAKKDVFSNVYGENFVNV